MATVAVTAAVGQSSVDGRRSCGQIPAGLATMSDAGIGHDARALAGAVRHRPSAEHRKVTGWVRCTTDVAEAGPRRLRSRTHDARQPTRHNVGMKIIHRPASAALTIALGVAAFFVGACLLMLRDGGWPWHASIGSPGVGATTAEIIDEDGTAYRFTGSPTDAQHWLDRKQ